jgi:DNA-binding transcriptional ArsR family regulator
MRDEVRAVDDPAALRALAHPLRLRLLGSLRVAGPATASELGRRLGESSGATSFHLRTLARHGFVEEDPERGTARERWWQAAERGTAWSLGDDDPGRLEAGRALSRVAAADHARWVARFLDEAPQWSREWREAAGLSDRWLTLTPERLAALEREVWQVIERYADEPSTEPDAARVAIVFDAVPQRGEVP